MIRASFMLRSEHCAGSVGISPDRCVSPRPEHSMLLMQAILTRTAMGCLETTSSDMRF